jgi:DNA-damage-inducible protein D
MSTLELASFEDYSKENGIVFWWATDLMVLLGYSSWDSFLKAVDRATKAFISLKIPYHDNIIPWTRVDQGTETKDFKLTRFACYLITMNADANKPEVARLQVYLAAQAEAFQCFIEQTPSEMERLLIREELIDGNKALASTAKHAGVTDYANFQNAGYLGLYNRTAGQLKKMRRVEKGEIFDTMGRAELAANLFRVTQTEEVIKSQNITGQKNLEDTHRRIGRDIRKMVEENTGIPPEYLPQERTLPEVRKGLKQSYTGMTKQDRKKSRGK